MGESSACLVRSFSQPSPTSSEEKKGNPLQRALTTSISFGRFMSESLDWGKWSAFTHNRYLEEVEKYSKPGSVAEKKAYFEAHFKRRRAAALLEQQNAAASNFSETNTENEVEDSSSLDLVTEKMDGEVQSSDPVVPVSQSGNYDASVERTLEDEKPKGIENVTEPLVPVENPVESTNHLENDGCIGDTVSKTDDNVCNKDDATLRSSVSSDKKREVSSSKLSTNGGASKCESSVKAIKPVQLKNSNETPDSKSKAMDSSNKRRSYTTSLHMSINFVPCSGAIKKDTSPDLLKIENSRIVRAPAKKYKNSVLPRTSTRASTNGLSKHHSATPQAENSRIMRPHGDSISGARTVDEKVQSPSSNYSKSSNLPGIKARLPTVPSSFTFKSEERALKRREFFQKLEQKTKSKETEKYQIHAKPQVKARSTDKDLRNSIALETTKNAEFPSINFTKKVPTVRPCYPKIEERTAFKVQDNDSRPPWRLSVKTEGLKDFTGKNSRPPSYSAKCFLTKKKSMNENASPNIQL